MTRRRTYVPTFQEPAVSRTFPLWGFLAVVLTAVFVALKLTSVISWPWLLVFTPIGIYVALYLLGLLVTLVLAAIAIFVATKNQ